MIVDASIILALGLREPTVPWVLSTLSGFRLEPLRISWVNVAEVGMALRRKAQQDTTALEALLERARVTPLDIDRDTVIAAIEAKGRFRLNFGDCFAYAHARLRRERLVTLDADFLRTDLEGVVHPDAGRS